MKSQKKKGFTVKKKTALVFTTVLILIIYFTLALLPSCGSFNKTVAAVKGYSEEEIDGVIYLQFPSGVTVKYNRDGSICTRK